MSYAHLPERRLVVTAEEARLIRTWQEGTIQRMASRRLPGTYTTTTNYDTYRIGRLRRKLGRTYICAKGGASLATLYPDGSGYLHRFGLGHPKATFRCPVGLLGQRLWLAEPWARAWGEDDFPLGTVLYRATAKGQRFARARAARRARNRQPPRSPWRGGGTMPRWACRTQVQIVSINLERDGGRWWWVVGWRRLAPTTTKQRA